MKAPARGADAPMFDQPRTVAMRKLIEAEGPAGSGRIVGLSIEGDGVFIYTNSHDWCDCGGSGTFRGDTEAAAIAAFRNNVMLGNGDAENPQPSKIQPPPNAHKPPRSIAAVNDAIHRAGGRAQLFKGDGYFYFVGDDVERASATSVYVYRLRSLTLGQWLDEWRDFKRESDERSGKSKQNT